MNIDYERLRSDLIDYYGTAMMINPIAVIDIGLIEKATNDKLIEIAIKNGFDLEDYEEFKIKKY